MRVRLLCLVVVIVASSLFAGHRGWAAEASVPQSSWDYHLGKGLRVGTTGITVGGYGSLRYEDLHDRPREFSASALSLLLSWDNGGRLHLFSELELEDIAVVRDGREFGSRSDPFEVERLYADVEVSDALNFRVGKFLTPVGRWNLIHADPLVWTTSRPLTTFHSFSQNTTGGMLYGTVTPYGKELKYSLYAEVTDELDADRHEKLFKQAAGFHLDYHITEATTLGLSYVNFESQEKGEVRESLAGADLFWTRRRFEITGEFVYRVGETSRSTDQWGIFVQGTVPLPAKFFVIGRYECFSPDRSFSEVHLWTAALAFRPIPPLIVKAEYSVGHRNHANVPEGFATSVSLLF